MVGSHVRSALAVVLAVLAVAFAVAASAMVALVSTVLLTVQGTAITLHTGALAILLGLVLLAIYIPLEPAQSAESNGRQNPVWLFADANRGHDAATGDAIHEVPSRALDRFGLEHGIHLSVHPVP